MCVYSVLNDNPSLKLRPSSPKFYLAAMEKNQEGCEIESGQGKALVRGHAHKYLPSNDMSITTPGYDTFAKPLLTSDTFPNLSDKRKIDSARNPGLVSTGK